MGKRDGGEFLRDRELYYNEQMFQFFSNPNFCLDNLNELLRKFNIQEFGKADFKIERFQLQSAI